ncbi:MAG: hypothetical protein IME93_00930, partial [Proteobacteria bacterium]|nr:hypothetical protein [Pseudomonadota bacterium]
MRDPYLQAMGIEQWVRREPHPQASDISDDESSVKKENSVVESVSTHVEDVPATINNTIELEASEIELTSTQSRESHNVNGLDWSQLEACVAECVVC